MLKQHKNKKIIEKGRDHKNDVELYRVGKQTTNRRLPNGTTHQKIVTTVIYRNRVIDLNLKEKDKNYITYTDWKAEKTVTEKVF